MRNPVSRHDFNRSSVHQDEKKASRPDAAEGLNDYLAELAEMDPADIAIAEYSRGVKDARIV